MKPPPLFQLIARIARADAMLRALCVCISAQRVVVIGSTHWKAECGYCRVRAELDVETARAMGRDEDEEEESEENDTAGEPDADGPN